LRFDLKFVGWWQPALGAFLLAVLLVFMHPADPADPNRAHYLRRAVETVVPLLFAVQAAFLLGPDNEPALELLASYPRPIPRIFLERLRLPVLQNAAVALAAMLAIASVWDLENPLLSLVRWLAAGIALGGVAVFTAQLTRQGVFATLLVTLLWAASLYGGDGILKIWKWFWPFHIYLQPETLGLETYLLNRLVLAAAGSLLTLLALKFLGDSDRLLGTR
jgi:hypothetical protein